MNDDIVGSWTVDRSDTRALTDLGDVLIEFKPDGFLIYTVWNPEKAQVMELHYHIEGTTIITDQPSSPRVEHTEFSLAGNQLTLAFGGTDYRFQRVTPG